MRRTRARWVVVTLVVTAVVAVGADRVALHRAEQAVSAGAVAEFGAAGDVQTQITAAPYLTSLLRGRIPRVVIHADAVTTPGAHLTDVTIDARGVGASGSYVAQSATLSALIATPDLEIMLADHLGLPVTLRSTDSAMRLDLELEGTHYAATIIPVLVQAGAIGFALSPEGLRAADGTAGDGATALAAALAELTVRPVQNTFPWVDEVQVTGAGLRISGERVGASAYEGEVY